MPDSAREPDAADPRVFATTHWSVVIAAGQDDSALARRALETLCAAYWYPIYVYVRRKGYKPEEAQDLTQEFFAQLIAKDHFRLADRSKGKFRGFLLATLDYFLAREWSRAHRQKRGGQFTFVSLDQQAPEERYKLEPADLETPVDPEQQEHTERVPQKLVQERRVVEIRASLAVDLERPANGVRSQWQNVIVPGSEESDFGRAPRGGLRADQPEPQYGRRGGAGGGASAAATLWRTVALRSRAHPGQRRRG